MRLTQSCRSFKGHEGCGEVVQVGRKISGFHPGDMVCIICNPGCGSCHVCNIGFTQLCLDGEQYGLSENGFYAPFVTVKERALVNLPKSVSPQVGAVATDAVLTAYHAVYKTAAVVKSQTILLFGLGGLGFNALQMILNIGARVLVVDTRPEVLDAAVEFGVPPKDVIPPGSSVVDFVANSGLEIDTVLDFAGKNVTFEAAQAVGMYSSVPRAYNELLTVTVRHAGRIVIVGVLDHNLNLNTLGGSRKQLSILLSYGGNREELKLSLDLISAGLIRPQVTARNLASFPEALKELDDGHIKGRVVLIPEGMPFDI